MLKSYKFTSREEPIRLQTVEVNPEKTPFEVTSPEEARCLVAGAVPGSVKVTREFAGDPHTAGGVDRRSHRRRRRISRCGDGKSGSLPIPALAGAQFSRFRDPACVRAERSGQGVRTGSREQGCFREPACSGDRHDVRSRQHRTGRRRTRARRSAARIARTALRTFCSGTIRDLLDRHGLLCARWTASPPAAGPRAFTGVRVGLHKYGPFAPDPRSTRTFEAKGLISHDRANASPAFPRSCPPNQRGDVRAAEILDGADAGRRGDIDLGEKAIDHVDADEQKATLAQGRAEGARRFRVRVR